MGTEDLYEIVTENQLIQETLYCLYMKYEVPDDVVEHCVDLCIESENYEICSEIRTLYEKIHGVGSFENLKK